MDISRLVIRDETAADVDAIERVTLAAFKTLKISNQTEHFIIAALRKEGALSVSLIAEYERRVVGHIAFSPVSVSDGTENWYGLGPVAVLPELHRQGIGKALIRAGLERLKENGARGCCLAGDPQYYKRFGFRRIGGFIHEGVPPEVFVALPFDKHEPSGQVHFHAAFEANGE